MKTAMQELIELLELNDKNEPMPYLIDSIKEVYMSKEKEQIINAFEVGYKSCDIDEAFEINRKLASGEQHYNQTYNQKTSPCVGHDTASWEEEDKLNKRIDIIGQNGNEGTHYDID